MTGAVPPRGVLFDLDGTLLDTAPDMAAALNRLRHSEGLAPMAFEAIRPHVSHGAARLVNLGFDTPVGERFESLRQRFLQVYSEQIAVDTRLFAGLEPVLATIEAYGIPWGIVTNKPGWLTAPLLQALSLDRRAACVVCGDTLPERKPHPLPLLHAAGLLERLPADCVYVGDAERDVQAGRAAGMRTVIAGFGYVGIDDDLAAWAADAIAATPSELLEHLQLDTAATA